MKIIHCADLHLDSKMESNLTRAQAEERRQELLDTFSRMVGFAEDNDVRIIMISGDLFDRAETRKSARKHVLSEISSHPDIDFLYLKGNHDQDDFLENIKESDIPDNLKRFSPDVWTSYIYEEDGNVIVISGRELTDRNVQIFTSNLILDPARLNIVMLHGQIVQGELTRYSIRLEDLKNKNIDYAAMGHFHSYQTEKIDERGVYCYSGCLEGRGFDECGEKGFVLLDAGKSISQRFIPAARRQMHELIINVSPEMTMRDIYTAMESACSGISGEDLVKFVMRGKTDIDIDVNRALTRFTGRFYFVKISDETGVYINYDEFKNDRSLKGEFVRLLQEEDIPDDEKSRIVETGIRAILGEDIIE